jgi:enterobacteria phage integrase
MKKRQSDKTKGLPLYLTVNWSNGTAYYRYKNKPAGKDISLGTNRAAAIRAAHEANSILIQRSSLTETIIGSRMKMKDLCAKFTKFVEKNINGLSASTLTERKTMINKVMAYMPLLAVEQLTVLKINEFFDWVYDPEEDDEDSGTPHARNATRKNLKQMIQYAITKGYYTGQSNPVDLTTQIKTYRKTKRHTYEGWMAIHDHPDCPHWLRCAMNMELITLQRRGDLLNIPMPRREDTYIEVIQQKTEKYVNTGYLKIEITPSLRSVIDLCRDNIASPFLIHRKPLNRKSARAGETHYTKVNPNYLSEEFRRIRDLANPYPDLPLDQQPSFHQGRALGIYLSKKKTDEYPQQLAGHADLEMTKNYERGHEDIEWTVATPTLDVLNRESIKSLVPNIKSA